MLNNRKKSRTSRNIRKLKKSRSIRKLKKSRSLRKKSRDGGKKRALSDNEENKHPVNKKIKTEEKSSSHEDTVMKSSAEEEDDIVLEDTSFLTKIKNLFYMNPTYIEQNKKYEKEEERKKK